MEPGHTRTQFKMKLHFWYECVVWLSKNQRAPSFFWLNFCSPTLCFHSRLPCHTARNEYSFNSHYIKMCHEEQAQMATHVLILKYPCIDRKYSSQFSFSSYYSLNFSFFFAVCKWPFPLVITNLSPSKPSANLWRWTLINCISNLTYWTQAKINKQVVLSVCVDMSHFFAIYLRSDSSSKKNSNFTDNLQLSARFNFSLSLSLAPFVPFQPLMSASEFTAWLPCLFDSQLTHFYFSPVNLLEFSLTTTPHTVFSPHINIICSL